MIEDWDDSDRANLRNFLSKSGKKFLPALKASAISPLSVEQLTNLSDGAVARRQCLVEGFNQAIETIKSMAEDQPTQPT